MRKRAIATAAAIGVGGAILAVGGTASADKPECNWGTLTAGAIASGFPQGAHSSDPSGDGHGPGTLDEPRAGLANVSYALFGGERGDLQTTCVFIDGLLNP